MRVSPAETDTLMYCPARKGARAPPSAFSSTTVTASGPFGILSLIRTSCRRGCMNMAFSLVPMVLGRGFAGAASMALRRLGARFLNFSISNAPIRLTLSFLSIFT